MFKMLRRFLWLFTGVGLGAGLTLRIQRRIQRTLAALRPGSVADRARTGVVEVGRDTRAAVIEGRRAMKAREAELRAELDRRRGTNSSEGTSKPPTSFV
jgi:hypothetical protein